MAKPLNSNTCRGIFLQPVRQRMPLQLCMFHTIFSAHSTLLYDVVIRSKPRVRLSQCFDSLRVKLLVSSERSRVRSRSCIKKLLKRLAVLCMLSETMLSPRGTYMLRLSMLIDSIANVPCAV